MSEPLIALRYDVSSTIGMGHASRARILANEFDRRRIPVIHAVKRAAIPLLQSWLSDSVQFVAVDSPNKQWQTQLSTVTDVIVDTLWHTNATTTYREVKTINTNSDARVTIIDSMPPDHFICSNCKVHALLTPYLDAQKYRPAPPKKTLWFNSPLYSLLGAEFEVSKNHSKSASEASIVICCGGSDTDHLSLQIVRSLINHEVPLHIVVGPLFDPELVTTLTDLAQKHSQLKLHYKPSSLAPLIAATSLVVGRPGLLRYEAAALGRSAVYLGKGFAYRDYFRGFNESGIATIFFDTDNQGINDFSAYIQNAANSIKDNTFSRDNHTASSLVDTKGAQRFVDALIE